MCRLMHASISVSTSECSEEPHSRPLLLAVSSALLLLFSLSCQLWPEGLLHSSLGFVGSVQHCCVQHLLALSSDTITQLAPSLLSPVVATSLFAYWQLCRSTESAMIWP